MNEELTKDLYEKLLINYMFNDEDVRSKMIPYLDPTVFMYQKNSQVVKHIQSFMEKYQNFPKMNELKLYIKSSETYEHLKDILNIDVSEYGKEFILGELEEFYRKSMFANLLIDSQEKLSSDTDKLQDIPDKIREALAFTFDTNIGLSILDDAERKYEALHNKDKVIPTGIKCIDDLIEGGSHDKSLSLILGQVNIGKSLILCSLASNFLLKNKNVLYISLEMSEEKIAERIDANLMDVGINDLKMLDKKTYMKKSEMIRKHIKSNLHIIQYGAKTVNANKIRAILKELKMKKNFKPDVVLIDYLGLMSTNNKSKDSNSYTEMKTVSEEVRAVLVEESIVGWSAIQTNRSGMNNVDLDMTNIADSIGTAATADLIIAVMQTDELKAAGRYKWSIIKNRYGLNGQYRLVGVDYPKMRVYDIEDEEGNEVQHPDTKTQTTKIVDDMAVEALKSLRNTSTTKKKEIIGFD